MGVAVFQFSFLIKGLSSQPQPSDLSGCAEPEDSALRLCALRLPAHQPSQLPSLPPVQGPSSPHCIPVQGPDSPHCLPVQGPGSPHCFLCKGPAPLTASCARARLPSLLTGARARLLWRLVGCRGVALTPASAPGSLGHCLAQHLGCPLLPYSGNTPRWSLVCTE